MAIRVKVKTGINVIAPSELKLVATGYYNRENTEFNLNNELEIGKTYLLSLFEDNLGGYSTAIVLIKADAQNCCMITIPNLNDMLTTFHLTINVSQKRAFVTTPNDVDRPTTVVQYIEFYELPFTLGGY